MKVVRTRGSETVDDSSYDVLGISILPGGVQELSTDFSASNLSSLGRVYRAEQPRLGRDVAVKLLHPHLLGDERSLARFYIEARAASRLNHPNSVAVIDFGLDPGGTPYLIMEFLRGQHLRALLNKSGPLPPHTAASPR